MDARLRLLHGQDWPLVEIAKDMDLHKNSISARVARLDITNKLSKRKRHAGYQPFEDEADSRARGKFIEAQTRAQENAFLILKLQEFHKSRPWVKFWLGNYGEICSNINMTTKGVVKGVRP
jgi:hypothetical protein